MSFQDIAGFSIDKKHSVLEREVLRVSLLTGGDDPNYAIPLASAIATEEITVEFIGNDEMQQYEIGNHKHIEYLNLRGCQNENVGMIKKVARIIRYYFRLMKYSVQTKSRIFHILWLNKFVHFDRTLLNAFYKILGKKIVLTAHNINEKERDGNDDWLNRFTLNILYRLADHIIVHTVMMKNELMNAFRVRTEKITVIKFGINEFIPTSDLTFIDAKKKLGLEHFKTLLFFGQIAPYKGLEYLVQALSELSEMERNIKLIIAGKVKRGCDGYWQDIENMIVKFLLENTVVRKIEYIPDNKIEVYFKAADALVLPYRQIFQSGPLFMAYKFGLPVIATDVGSFRDDILDGKTGLVCNPRDPHDLAKKILLFFESELYKELPSKREEITNFAMEIYSWKNSAYVLKELYKRMLYEN